MSAEYILEQFIIGPRLQLSISEGRYKELAHARNVLSEALAFEQRYELLLGNFLAMELAFTEICLRTKVEPQHRYMNSAEILETANRHVVNTLTAMRAYADQVVQDFKCLELVPSFSQVAKSELNEAFSRSLDYRFMCSLRNHVQHKATAVHGFVADDDRMRDANGWVETVTFYANKEILRVDKDFKLRVLDEQPQKIDIRRRARRSVQAVGEVHLALRNLSKKQVAQARSAIELAIREYKEAGAESIIGLGARRIGDTTADVALLLDWDDVRLQLVNKNSSLPRLWPRRSHSEAKVEEIIALREAMEQTQAQAAALVFVTEDRWRDYEDGLPMPEGLFLLYKLQVGRHPTHTLQQLNAVDE
ncbi:hypothetical protein PSH92_03915 [Pseudomonas beijingensis]|uniref:HEPN AbiU2-like domain-containing protein n=1 Tax=Pseudomonas beijingensis TaxID=2954101 RepID=A0ABY9FEN6_9PSED|nr:hypothetical protein [Pseudomonas sp. FP2034]WLH02026.1 hypothetical protein PSH92_03915 [Pseudomonas sp. FP2034]